MYSPEIKRVVKYISYNNHIKFPTKLGSAIIPDFCSAILEFKKRRPNDLLTLDMSNIRNPYSNGLLPIIATVTDLRLNGYKIRVELPNDHNVRKIMRTHNWAHFLCPQEYKISESKHDRHLVTRQFTDYTQLTEITKDFMDVVLRNMPIPKDIVSGLEWSISELCDNVINHSESKVGGFVQLITFPKQDMISFTISDAGRGILNSLKEGIPSLRTDIQAIGEAIKAGVTRNKEVGQGNGLAGSLSITNMAGGSLDIISGTGRFISRIEGNSPSEASKNQIYHGTSVNGNMLMKKSFSIEEALNFGGPFRYAAVNTIDLDYEMPDENCLLLTMKNETTGFGTRHAGRQMRTKTLNLIASKPNYPINVDWSGIVSVPKKQTV